MVESKPKKNVRKRLWTMIVYPESAPKDWQSLLAKQGISALISPLHDKDTNPDGTIKKAHWHVMLVFKGLKSFQQVSDIAKSFHAPMPEPVKGDGTGMARYFIHMDNPEKYQYRRQDMKAVGGLDIDTLLKPTTTDRHKILSEIFDFISEYQVSNLMILVGCAKRLKKDMWLDVIYDRNTMVVSKMLDAEYQYLKRPKEQRKSLDDEIDAVLEKGGN